MSGYVSAGAWPAAAAAARTPPARLPLPAPPPPPQTATSPTRPTSSFNRWRELTLVIVGRMVGR